MYITFFSISTLVSETNPKLSSQALSSSVHVYISTFMFTDAELAKSEKGAATCINYWIYMHA